eukprot:TRINITY_DN567_c0_g2_i3.p1 TRINITY_DN567_c0_g2~~TRINITY_DN567_c0_g2_i3.p1  ORF type:complete len:224 (+),score=43.56 TRINITY_DN567_c0_g2_i3:86-757(+)
MATSAASVAYPSSLMIQNVPSRATAQDVMEAVNSLGFKGMYDFFYLPDRVPNRGQPVNPGYAFINFKDCKTSATFAESIAEAGVTLRNSPKTLTVSPANVQGREALLACSRNKQGKERFVEDPMSDELVSLEQAASLKKFSEKMCEKAEVEENAELPGPKSQTHMPFGNSFSEAWEYALRTPGGDADEICGRQSVAFSSPMYIQIDTQFYSNVATMQPFLCAR